MKARETHLKQVLWPLSAGLLGMFLMASIYFGLISWAESPQHAMDLLYQETWLIIPLFIGFGIQTALYVVIKKRLFFTGTDSGHPGTIAGTGGATSTLAMVACCAHHVADVFPILGLTFAATFLARYQRTFMQAALLITVGGIIVMIITLLKERKRYLEHLSLGNNPS